MWITWTEMAFENEAKAAEIRRQALNVGDRGAAMEAEFRAALVAIVAAAFAIEAVFNEVEAFISVPRETAESWKKAEGGSRRWARIQDTLGRGVRGNPWPNKFQWLFGLRRDAVHYKAEFAQAVPHPLGGNAAAIYRTFSPDVAEHAVDFLMQVVQGLVEHPKSELEKWAADMRPTVERIQEGR